MTTTRAEPSCTRPSIALVAGAFLAVYVLWGSTYLGIKFAIETIPPFLMAGSRFMLAGVILAAYMRGRKQPRPTAANWRAAITVGLLMLVGGNGLVTFAEQYIASGLAALLIATVPLWLVTFDWLFCRGPRPTPLIVTGLAVGLVGVYLLIGPADIAGERAHPLGAAITLGASVFWAAGSLYSRRAPLPKSTLSATWMEMLAAGAAMLLIGTVVGEWSRFEPAAVSWKSILSVVYLSLFGSIVALTAYTWLLKVSTPARVGTYAYVNPVVAMALGAMLANEPLTLRVVVAAAIILASVVMITLAKTRQATRVDVSPIRTRDVDDVSLAPSAPRPAHRVSADADGSVHHVDELLAAHQAGGLPYFEFLRVDSMSMGMYVLPVGGVDTQSPHGEDEVYYVLRGRAKLRVGDVDHEIGPGSIVYVEREQPHWFHDITQPLHTLVFFSPAERTGQSVADQTADVTC